MTTTPAIFAAAKARAVSHNDMLQFYHWQHSAPGYGARINPTFGQRRTILANRVAQIKCGIAAKRHSELRWQIIQETPACQSLISQLQAMDYLPSGERASAHKAPVEAKLEAIIAGRMAELECVA